MIWWREKRNFLLKMNVKRMLRQPKKESVRIVKEHRVFFGPRLLDDFLSLSSLFAPFFMNFSFSWKIIAAKPCLKVSKMCPKHILLVYEEIIKGYGVQYVDLYGFVGLCWSSIMNWMCQIYGVSLTLCNLCLYKSNVYPFPFPVFWIYIPNDWEKPS